MIRHSFVAFSIIASLLSSAAAQEHVTVGTMRDVRNGALFMAADRGYFKAEGLDLEMTAYKSDSDVAQALAGGGTDFALAGFTTDAFKYAGQGLIKAIAVQVREKKDYEGNQIVVSNAVYSRGLRKPEQLVGISAAIGQIGSVYHYLFAQIARVKGFDPNKITLKPHASVDGIADAVTAGKVDAAILPSNYARGLLTSNQAKLVAWYSDVDEPQLGALFVSAKLLQTKRATVEKFLRAYRKGAAAYNDALMHHDKYGKRVSNTKSHEAAGEIARYVYPLRAGGSSIVEGDAYYLDAQARIDMADLTRQVEWYKAQGLIDKKIDAREIVDLKID
jgi:NitT/TauT family transport system substrate-binding protein